MVRFARGLRGVRMWGRGAEGVRGCTWAAGSAAWGVGCGCGGRVPLRQALNRLSRLSNRRRMANQSSIASDTVLPVCRTEATRVLRWPDAMRARGIIAMNVVLYNAIAGGKEKMRGRWIFFARAASARKSVDCHGAKRRLAMTVIY